MKKIIILIILIFIVGFTVNFLDRAVYQPKDYTSPQDKIFIIEKGENVFKVAENLEQAGLIVNRLYFSFYIILKNSYNKLQAGEYYLSSGSSIVDIAKTIIAGDTVKVIITIPEGYTVKQIEEKIGMELPGEDLEGYLFPDTYQFSFNFTAAEVVKKMQDNFKVKLTSELRAEIERQNKTVEDIVIMASVIEKEVRTLEDKKMVSDVLWKRLSIRMPLQVDAEEWTYGNLGLPPKPICNPGLESIEAAIYPEANDYWYYLSAKTGETIFSKTLTEHNIARAKYLR